MSTFSYLPVLELTRGEAVESVHYGAIAIVNSLGKLIASQGNPDLICFLRSSAKPFQALPFIEMEGHKHWDFSTQEIAIMCASHTGTDDHFDVLNSMQLKIGVSQNNLLCGIHPPVDIKTRDSLLARGEKPTPNRHNCSGKHTGMLAHAKLINAPISNYIQPHHPVQKKILKSFIEICDVDPDEISIGIDGCSAPVFAVSLRKAAYGLARLCDPHSLSPEKASACKIITNAMMSHPGMVAGPGCFDTRLMDVTDGKIVSKGGAEGYQQIGILPNVISPDSPGVGIAMKISDGDAKNRARPAVTLEILRQMGAISNTELEELSEFGPKFPVENWRKIVVGKAYPVISLKMG